MDNKITIIEINDNEEKNKIFKVCDIAFEKSIYQTENGKNAIKKICENGILIAAYEEKQICGYLSMYANDFIEYNCYINMFAVIPNKQKLGIGKCLLDKCISIAKEKQMKYVKLEVLNNNEKALSFYKKNNFKFDSICSDESKYLKKVIE